MERVGKKLLYLLALVPAVVLNAVVYLPGAKLYGDVVMFPFVTGKNLLIRLLISAVWVVLAITLLKREGSGSIRLKKSYVKNPVFLGLCAVMLSGFLSALFGESPFRSFLGDAERGVGYLMIFIFFSFLVAALMLFEKKDWFTFLKINLFVGLVISIDGYIEAITGIERIQSWLGNPLFLAVYFLFLIFCSVFVLAASKENQELIGSSLGFWRKFSATMLVLSFFGVFLTGTRSAILGLALGLAASTIYFAFKGRQIFIRKVSLQKISLALILIGVLFSLSFLATMRLEFWQKVPGLSRVAGVSLEDKTFQTRLIAAGVGLNSISPQNEGWTRTLFGWGQENFLIAYNKYFNPEYLRYENLWFDRAHNQLVDYFAMQGVVGILVYLVLEILILLAIVRKFKNPLYAAGALFFLTAHFAHTFFTFDEITSYIPLLTFIGLVIVFSSKEEEGSAEQAKSQMFLKSFAWVLAIGLSFSAIFYGIIPVYQNFVFVGAIKSGDAQHLLSRVDNFSKPYNHVQKDLRYQYIKTFLPIAGSKEAEPIFSSALSVMKDYVAREPHDPRRFIMLGTYYSSVGDRTGDKSAYAIAKEYYLKALELTPTRQEVLYSLAVNAADRGDFKEHKEYLDQMFSLGPDIPRVQLYYSTGITMTGPERYLEAIEVMEKLFSENPIDPDMEEIGVFRNAYNRYLNYYYERRDAENFLRAMKLAKTIETHRELRAQSEFERGIIAELPPKESARLELGINAFEERGWDAIDVAN